MSSGVTTSARSNTPDLTQKSFADFGVSEPIVRALAEEGITFPFPIQALTLPVALERRDIIGQAKTGTGKTLGFGIPMLENTVGPDETGWEKLPENLRGLPQGLVILPTRELAKQVAGELRMAGKHRTVRVMEIYGGVAYEPQYEELRRGADIVVGTPGRIIDLMRHKALQLSHVKTVVLDEADEMLDLGFLPDVETILAQVPDRRQTMLFSATMPGAVITMARRYMHKPTHIRAQAPGDDSQTVKNIRQLVYRVHAMNKDEVIARILQARGRGLALIFTRTKRSAARLAEDLQRRGFATAALHGDLGQAAREQALRAFRNGKVDVLVATDVAARGIDVDDVTHVINYQCPEDEKTYVHRIGRTGRAGSRGTAITFVDWDDVPRWKLIDKQLDLELGEPVETYHTSPHMYSDLDIPEEVGSTLPKSERTLAGLAAEKIEDLDGGRSRRSGRGRRGARGPQSGRGARGEWRSSGKRGGRSERAARTGRASRTGSASRDGRASTRERQSSQRETASTPVAGDRRRRRLSTATLEAAATKQKQGESAKTRTTAKRQHNTGTQRPSGATKPKGTAQHGKTAQKRETARQRHTAQQRETARPQSKAARNTVKRTRTAPRQNGSAKQRNNHASGNALGSQVKRSRLSHLDASRGSRGN
ncbi:ATP-dependent RNA helicase [Actinobaculum suis]|uniref:RNA helicase n=1 Tax=Actinobaculum suis TaxID=1657 RepID=A0A7Z8Y8E5_9ACTO|nr:ATP-dependent RNA helicase [Actinobaculum suis]